MGIAIFILGIVGFLGVFSVWKNRKKKAIVDKVIQEFIIEKQGKLISVEKPFLSGPFNDDYYDAKQENLYENIGYEPKETIYRKIEYKVEETTYLIWLQIRIENIKATYTRWREEV